MTVATSRPWNDRIFEAVPIAPFWPGLGLSVALLLLLLLLVLASGELSEFLATGQPWWMSRDARLAVMIALIGGYVPTARRYATIAAGRNLEALRASGLWPVGREHSGSDPAVLDPAMLRRVGACFLLVVPLSALLIDRDPSLYLQEGYWRPISFWTWGLGGLVCWNAGILYYGILARARSFSDLARRIPRLDLLNLRPLAPFSRQGLHSAVPWLVFMSFWAVNLVDRDFVWVLGVMGTLSLAGASAAFLLPVRGVHERIRDEKRRELECVDAAIRGDLSALHGSAIASRADSIQLADLIAYRELIGSVREWPFDAATGLRFMLYLALPIGSWFGGALVERLLEAALR